MSAASTQRDGDGLASESTSTTQADQDQLGNATRTDKSEESQKYGDHQEASAPNSTEEKHSSAPFLTATVSVGANSGPDRSDFLVFDVTEGFKFLYSAIRDVRAESQAAKAVVAEEVNRLIRLVGLLEERHAEYCAVKRKLDAIRVANLHEMVVLARDIEKRPTRFRVHTNEHITSEGGDGVITGWVGIARNAHTREKRVEDDLEKQLTGLREKTQPVTRLQDSAARSDLGSQIDQFAKLLNARIADLRVDYFSLAKTASLHVRLIKNTTMQIGHKDLRAQARARLSEMDGLAIILKGEVPLDGSTQVLGSSAQQGLRFIEEIYKQKLVIDGLLTSDRRRRDQTVYLVMLYVVAALGVLAASMWYGNNYTIGATPLSQSSVPIVGVPWPVLVWSAIGSFAAMIYRFNHTPVHDFGDTVKWLITRPIQGMVLGGALYLLLSSGLYLLTGGALGQATSTTPGSSTTGVLTGDFVVLILSFLVGFSDRFADSVFSTLVDRYTTVASKTDTGKVETKTEETTTP